MDIERLRLLETRIEDILTQYAAVCQERDRLKVQLSEAELQAKAASAQLAEQEKARAEIKARVERILDRLDGLALG